MKHVVPGVPVLLELGTAQSWLVSIILSKNSHQTGSNKIQKTLDGLRTIHLWLNQLRQGLTYDDAHIYIYNIYNYIYTHIPDWESLTVAVSSQMFTPIARAQHLFLNDPLARCTRFTFGFLTWKASTPNHPGPTWRDDVTAAPMEDIHIEPQTMGASGQLWNIQLQYNFTMVHDNSNPSDMVIVVVMLMVMVIVMVMVMMMMMVVMMMMVASW